MNLDKFLQQFHNEGAKLYGEGRTSEVIWTCEHVAVQALNSLGLAYCTYLRNYSKALECFKDAVKIDPGNWLLHSNLTHVYCLMDDNKSALRSAYKAVDCSMGVCYDPFYNAGVVLTNLGKIKEAENMYRSAKQLNPTHPNTNFNLALNLLRQGKYEEGWELYEYRYITGELTGKFKKRYLQDQWDGRKFKKKTLVVYSEQGLGDFLFFGRFLPKVKELGGKVICEVQEPIAELVKDNFDVEVVSRPNNNNWPKAPESDYCISVCSLPKVLKIYDENQIKTDPYINSKRKTKLKGGAKKLKIGVCWSGNSDHHRDHTRSLPVMYLKPLSDLQSVQLYSLAKGTIPQRLWPTGWVNLDEGKEKLNMIDLASQIQDYSDLANIIESLDLVVTVDTGLAHLCGAMGKPVWVLIGKETDWRWMDQTDKSIWYESARLFRFKTTWEDLIQEVVAALPVK